MNETILKAVTIAMFNGLYVCIGVMGLKWWIDKYGRRVRAYWRDKPDE